MRRLSRKGFTLSELMIAAAILATAVLGLLAAFINCFLLNETNSNLVIAANDAQYVLEQIKGRTYDNIDTYAPPVFNNLIGETVMPPTVVVIASGLKEVTVNISWTERQRSRSFALSTRIAR